MKTCSKTFADLPFAHRQWSHPGHCRHIHGHNWSFTFEFTADQLNDQGFVVDFGKLKWLKDWINIHFDHTCVLANSDPLLNQFMKVGGDEAWNITAIDDPSCEGVAKFLYEEVNKLLKGEHLPEADRKRGIKVVSVVVYEDSKNSAKYT